MPIRSISHWNIYMHMSNGVLWMQELFWEKMLRKKIYLTTNMYHQNNISSLCWLFPAVISFFIRHHVYRVAWTEIYAIKTRSNFSPCFFLAYYVSRHHLNDFHKKHTQQKTFYFWKATSTCSTALILYLLLHYSINV